MTDFWLPWNALAFCCLSTRLGEKRETLELDEHLFSGLGFCALEWYP